METITHRAAAAIRRLRADQSARSDLRGDQVDDLAQRVEHLESALEGLQDAVYREDVVHDLRIVDLRTRQVTGPNARSPGQRGERR